MEETTESLLNEWGMLELLPDCERLGIDIEALRYMQEDDLQILVPNHRLGIRIKLRQRLKEWKLRMEHDTNLNLNHITSNNIDNRGPVLDEYPQLKRPRKSECSDGKICQDDTYDSYILSDSNYDLTQDFDENSDGDNSINQITNHVGQITNVNNFENQAKQLSSAVVSFDLDEVLSSTHKGQCVREYFEKHKKLDSESRRHLTDCVCEHFIKINQRMSSSEMDGVANAIVRRFPTELKETYYIPRDKNNRLPKGKLRNKFNNCVRSLRLKGLRGLSAATKRPQTAKVKPKVCDVEIGDNCIEDVDIDSNYIDIKVWLKSNCEPWEKVKIKWKITSHKRIQVFHQKLQTDLTSILHDWPTLTKMRGYECIEIDFDTLYPIRVDFIAHKWKDFIDRFMTKCSKDIKDPPSKSLLNDIANDPNIAEDGVNCIVFCLLGSILRRGYNHKTKNGEFVKPNISDIQNCLVLHVPEIEQYSNVLDKYVKRCTELEIGNSPSILAVGPELRNATTFFVHFENFNYKFNSFLEAMTICFKMFHVLNVIYPKPTENVWSFVQKYFFDITTARDVSSIAISAFLSDLMN